MQQITKRAAEEHIMEAFRHFAEARRELTLWEFENYIRASVVALGHKGFVESMGKAITDAVSKPQTIS